MSQRPITTDGFSEADERQNLDACGAAPQLMWINIAQLVVDTSYQREITAQGKRNVRAIARAFTWCYFSPVIVAPLSGGLYAIVDGQHRTTAAALVGHPAVPCQVILAAPHEQAKAFTAVNGSVTRVHTLAMHKAAVAAGDAAAREIERVVAAGGAQVLAYPVPELKQRPGQTMAIGALRDMIREFGSEAVTLGLRSITQTSNAVVGGLTATILRGVCTSAALWLVQGRDPDAFIAAVGDIVLIREADKAARGERPKGQSAASALIERLRSRLGLAR
jgi:hypothetical protein